MDRLENRAIGAACASGRSGLRGTPKRPTGNRYNDNDSKENGDAGS